MKFLIVTTFALLVGFTGAVSHADSFKSVEKKENYVGVYEMYARYPQLLPQSVVSSYEIINKQIEEMALQGCGASAEEIKQEIEEFYGKDSQISYDSSINAKIVGLNPNYVGVEANSSSFCGGAHPNYGTYYLTFDSKTGEYISFDTEVPLQNSFDKDWEKFQAFQKELAKIIYKNIAPQIAKDAESYNGCYSEQSKQEVLESLEMFYPMISGYAANKKVVLTINPPHVATPCALSVRVPFSQVEKFFAPNAKAKQWLK